MEIRDLTYGDLAQLVSIERRSFSAPWSLAMFVLELSNVRGMRFAVVDGERILGYLIVGLQAGDYHVMTVAVDPGERRRGVGSALIAEMIERGGEDANYTLEVRVSNVSAIGLYERFGFESAGVRPNYYPDREDAMIMWRSPTKPWLAT